MPLPCESGIIPMSDDFVNDPEFNDAIPKVSSRRGPGVFEVLVILGIIAVLIALPLPSTSHCSARVMNQASCMNNLKQIALALRTYEQAYKAFPPAYTVDAEGRPLHSWRTLILPFIEQDSLYRTIDLSKPWNDPANAKAHRVLTFRLPVPRGAQGPEYDDLPGDRRARWLLDAQGVSTPGGGHRPSRVDAHGDRGRRGGGRPVDVPDGCGRDLADGPWADHKAPSRRGDRRVLRR